jgi:glycosyltransferase involved in cell wall biosynthesis
MLPLRDRHFDEQEPVRISICCITFNHRPYIEKCIEGFLEQRCDFRVEILLHDDASTDGTSDVLKEYAARYPSLIRVVQQLENMFSKGVNPYYAYLFPISRGDYIAICDGDDFWEDDQKLMAQVAFLDANPDTVIVYGPALAFKGEDQIIGPGGGAARDLTAPELKSGEGLNTLTTCFRNVFQNQPPPAFLKSSPVGDVSVWAYLAQFGHGKYMPELKPAKYRLHSGGVLSMVSRQRKVFMSALAHLSIAAFHADRQDAEGATLALKKVVDSINESGYMSAVIVNTRGMSLYALLRVWYKSRRRSDAVARND